MKNILALIPARGGSKGILKKNIKSLNGKPLISYTIKEALKSKRISRVIVSTDDKDIADIALQYGAEVPFYRPKDLAGDRSGDFEVIEHAVNFIEKDGWKVDCIVFLRPTNIFRTANDIDKGIEEINNGYNFDSVRAISDSVYSPYWMKRIENKNLIPFIDSEYELSRRQDLPKVYQGNGTFEIIKRDTIIKLKSMYGSNIGSYRMGEIANTDIDTELDFLIAEFLYPKWKNGDI